MPFSLWTSCLDKDIFFGSSLFTNNGFLIYFMSVVRKPYWTFWTIIRENEQDTFVSVILSELLLYPLKCYFVLWWNICMLQSVLKEIHFIMTDCMALKCLQIRGVLLIIICTICISSKLNFEFRNQGNLDSSNDMTIKLLCTCLCLHYIDCKCFRQVLKTKHLLVYC